MCNLTQIGLCFNLIIYQFVFLLSVKKQKGYSHFHHHCATLVVMMLICIRKLWKFSPHHPNFTHFESIYQITMSNILFFGMCARDNSGQIRVGLWRQTISETPIWLFTNGNRKMQDFSNPLLVSEQKEIQEIKGHRRGKSAKRLFCIIYVELPWDCYHRARKSRFHSYIIHVKCHM